MAEQQQMTPEQVEELKEKLKNMSPEELREFQKKQCIFCHIVSGKVAGKKIYEDNFCLAVLDINPGNPGHVLLLPKEHYAIMPQIPETEIKHLFTVAKYISNAQLRGLEATGTNMIVANGPAAGQKAQHFMIHIIPRKEKDNLKFNIPQKQMDEKAVEAVREAVSKKIGFVEAKEISPSVEKRVIDAEIIEPRKEKRREPEKKIEKKKEPIPVENKIVEEKKEKTEEENIDLDDIARVLGVR